ncbi:DNA N-6-adenine-methyltransferase (Dam) [Pycnococcus provasolii]
MASKSATTLASSPPKPSTVAPTSVWSLLGEQGFEASAFSSFFEPSVAEGKESIELPKGCGAHLLYGVAPHELSTAVQAYGELLSLKLAYHQPEEEEPSRRANTELGRLLRYHGDVEGLAALTDDSEFSLAAYFNSDGQEDFVSHGDNALASDLQNGLLWAPCLAGVPSNPTRVLLRTDNTTTMAVFNKRASAVEAYQALIQRLNAVIDKYHLDVAAQHIRGVDNQLADQLSRQFTPSFERDDWCMRQDVFEWVENTFGEFDVDACAHPLGNNAMCPRFWSIVEPCTAQSWRHRRVWCNPPYRADIISEILQHAWAEHFASPADTSAVFVLPAWTTASWWRALKGQQVIAVYPAGAQLFTTPPRSAREGDFRQVRRSTQWPSCRATLTETRFFCLHCRRSFCDRTGCHGWNHHPLGMLIVCDACIASLHAVHDIPVSSQAQRLRTRLRNGLARAFLLVYSRTKRSGTRAQHRNGLGAYQRFCTMYATTAFPPHPGTVRDFIIFELSHRQLDATTVSNHVMGIDAWCSEVYDMARIACPQQTLPPFSPLRDWSINALLSTLQSNYKKKSKATVALTLQEAKKMLHAFPHTVRGRFHELCIAFPPGNAAKRAAKSLIIFYEIRGISSHPP